MTEPACECCSCCREYHLWAVEPCDKWCTEHRLKNPWIAPCDCE